MMDNEELRYWVMEYVGDRDLSAAVRDLAERQSQLEKKLDKPLERPTMLEIAQLRYEVEQARAGFLYLQKKLNEHLDKKKKSK